MKNIMMFLIFILASTVCSQEFQLTNINSIEYSIDKIAQHVYFEDYFSGTIMKVDLRDMSITNTGWYVLLPFFANKHHFMLYGNRSSIGDSSKDNIYLFNLDSQSYYQVTDTIGFPSYVDYGSFSPNDSFLINPEFYFSLKDSSINPFTYSNIEYSINDSWPEWSSDTSFVFLSGTGSDSVVAEYFLKSGEINTLVTVHQYNTIRGFSYNRKYGILAYSIFSDTSKIYFHYVNENIPDSLIFEPEDINAITDLQALRWSPDNSRLAFISTWLDIGSEIYVYDLDSNKTYHVGGGGYADHLKWANNDTLVFVNESQYLLYGIDVSSIYTSVKETKEKAVPNKFTISNYPNPFNLSTRLEINISPKEPFSIKIYDTLGKLVKTIDVNPQSTESTNISWDGTNNSGKVVSTGVYFATALVNNEIHSNTIKLILLK